MNKYQKYILAALIVAPAPLIWQAIEPYGVSKIAGFAIGVAMAFSAIYVLRKF